MKQVFFFIIISACSFLPGCCKQEACENSVNEADKVFAGRAASENYRLQKFGSTCINHSDAEPVKTFAGELLNEHAVADGSLKIIASDLVLPLENQIDPVSARLHEQLTGMSGRSFDSVFIHNELQAITLRKDLYIRHQAEGINSRLKAYSAAMLSRLDAVNTSAGSLADNYR